MKCILRTAILCLLLAASVANAQIVHLTDGFSERPGWSCDLGVDLGLSGGNTDLFTLEGAGRLQLLEGSERWRLVFNGGRSESDGEIDDESTTFQIRHNHLLSARLATLAFTQHQYKPFQRLEGRLLFGVGLRWEAIRRDRMRFGFSAGPMLELESFDGEIGDRRAWRLSTISNLELLLSETARFELFAYVQPVFSEPSDLRTSLGATLVAELGARLTMSSGLSMSHDSDPAEGVSSTDWKIQSGIGYSF